MISNTYQHWTLIGWLWAISMSVFSTQTWMSTSSNCHTSKSLWLKCRKRCPKSWTKIFLCIIVRPSSCGINVTVSPFHTTMTPYANGKMRVSNPPLIIGQVQSLLKRKEYDLHVKWKYCKYFTKYFHTWILLIFIRFFNFGISRNPPMTMTTFWTITMVA